MEFFSYEPLIPGEVAPFWHYEKRHADNLCIHDVAITILNTRLWFSWTTSSPPDPINTN